MNIHPIPSVCVHVCVRVRLSVLFPANDVSRFFPCFFFLKTSFHDQIPTNLCSIDCEREEEDVGFLTSFVAPVCI